MLICTDVGVEFGDARPLDEGQMQMLTINNIQLRNRLVCNQELIDDLATVGSITWTQRDHIMKIDQQRPRNNQLLEIISRRSVGDFNKFISILSKDQAHLLHLLLTDGGNMFCVYF